MLDTISVFDNLEMDNTQRRVASRRALALAHNRVERSLGSFLRGARSEEEFEERLVLLQDEFAGYVTTASQEVGHEHPEHIAAALKDHYRLAAKAVEFVETPAEEEEAEEKEKKEARVRWSHIKVLGGPVNPMLDQLNPLQNQPQGAPTPPGAPGQVPGAQVPGQGLVSPGVQGNPALEQQSQGAPVAPDPRRAKTEKESFDFEPLQSYEDRGSFGQRPNLGQDAWGNAGGGLQACPKCGGAGYNGKFCAHCGFAPNSVAPPGYGGQMGMTPQAKTAGPHFDPTTQPGYRDPYRDVQGDPMNATWGPHDEEAYPEFGDELGQALGFGQPAPHPLSPDARQRARQPGPWVEGAAQNPAEQRDTSPDTVTCPECGGDGRTAGRGKCAKCAGKGKVRNFGDSAVDTYGADIKTSADGNTGLDGPEPKMNKGQGPGSMPDVPGDIVEKDIVEPIKATNESNLSGIGDIKTESLPSETENAGFQTGGEDSGPHTKTFGDGGQANPVTHETLSSHNPLSDILTSEFPPDQVVNEALLSLHE